jgi:glycosyltransferase involved in cell wall biosynthesis
MKLSIIVPVYNTEAFLRDCLSSICTLNQHKDVEVIIVNDCSPDNSDLIIQNFKNKYSFIKLVTHPFNKGLSSARNSGLSISTGEFVLFVDSDDTINFENLYNLLGIALRELIDVLEFNLFNVDETKLEESSIVTGKDFLYHSLNTNSFKFSACSRIYSREFLIKNELLFEDGLLHEDVEYTFRLYACAQRVIYTDYNCYFIRDNLTSITNTSNLKRLEDLLIIANKINSSCSEKALINMYLEQVSYSFLSILNSFQLGLMDKKIYINKFRQSSMFLALKDSSGLKSKLTFFLIRSIGHLFLNLYDFFKKGR